MTGFFDEVKRRKVYRVAAAYIIAAGGIIQLASAAFPAWELPNWALRLVIVPVAHRLSNRAHACLGLRHHRARRSGNANASGTASASSSQHDHACRNRRGHFRRRRVLSPAARLGAQDATSRLRCCRLKI